MKGSAVCMAVSCCLLVGCATAVPPPDTAAVEPQTPLRDLCDSGRYHEAMRALPGAMRQWAAYTERTGRTCEGAAGYEYATTMMAVAIHGDADWGKILDDPDIPYAYKTEMVFEILETRLGKGAVYVGSRKYLLVPRLGVVDLGREMIRLPEEDGREHAPADRADPPVPQGAGTGG